MQVDQAVILAPQQAQQELDSTSPGWNSREEILGLTVLKRLILTASQSGVKDFILIGNQGEEWLEIVASLRSDERLKDRSVELEAILLSGVGNIDWGKRLRRRFWLIEGDLVMDPEVLTRAAQADPGGNTNLHLIEAHPEAEAEGDGILRCRMDEARRKILAFGGLPAESPAVYSGISLCSDEVFPRLALMFRERGTIRLNSEIMNEIFLPSRPEAFDIGRLFCFRIASRADSKKAERYLLNTARKPTDGFFSRHFNRPISLFLTRQLIKLNMTPIQLSVSSFLVGLMSVWFIGKGGHSNSVLGALLFEFASIFDGCDGENARLTFRATKTGALLDIICDAVIFVLFFLSLPIGLFNATRDRIWLLLGMIAFLSMSTFYYLLVDYAKKAGIGSNIVAVVKEIENSAARPGLAGLIDRIASRIAFIYRRDFFATAASLFILLGGAWVFIWILTFLLPLQAIYMSFYSRRRLRQIPASA